MLTLWDLVPTARVRRWIAAQLDRGGTKRAPASMGSVTIPPRASQKPAPRPPAKAHRPQSAAARYEALVEEMLALHGIRVRKWRTSMSGVAWRVRYRDGREAKLIESPKPKGPMSAAIFLHEVGHHAIGLGAYKPRCLEEYHAWAWALDRMRERDITVTDAVHRRMHLSLAYAVAKAKRRGLRALPPELEPFKTWPNQRAGTR